MVSCSRREREVGRDGLEGGTGERNEADEC